MNQCGCNDWQMTHRRAMLRRQGQLVPIPRAVLEGETAGICRRDFLRNGAVAFLTVYGASMMSWSRIWEAAAARAATPSTDPIIVSIFLDGGNDGLNTLVPVTGADYAAYVTKRPNIGLDPVSCLPLGGAAATPDWRWNPAATGMEKFMDIVCRAGGFAPNAVVIVATAKALKHHAGLEDDPRNSVADNLKAIELGSQNLARHIQNAKEFGVPCVVAANRFPVDDAQFWLENVWTDEQLMVDALAGLAQRSALNGAMDAADGAVGGAVNVANRLSALTQPALPPSGFSYGNTDFDRRMANLAWLLDSNLGMRTACLSFDGGWDFHDSQISRQAQNLSQLSTTLAAFQADIEARGLGDRVITLVWSEFGRRVEDNNSGGGGTDHGAGGLAMVIGTRAKPGIASAFPGITDNDLDQWGNLKVPTDYRQIYTNLLGSWMGTDPADVIPQAAGYTPLDLVA